VPRAEVLAMIDCTFKRPESVLVVVYSRDGFILLLKRSDIEDFWQSVTGSLNWGESAPAAAMRELREETGINAGLRLVDWRHSARFDIIDTFRHRYGPGIRQNVENLFSIEVERDHRIVLDQQEHVSHEWKSAAEAIERVWSWSNRDAIAAVAKKYRL